MIVRVELSTMSDCIVVISGDDVCCSVVFGTLVGVFVFCVMWLLMTYAISYPLWSSVYECHKVECAFTSPVSRSPLKIWAATLLPGRPD